MNKKIYLASTTWTLRLSGLWTYDDPITGTRLWVKPLSTTKPRSFDYGFGRKKVGTSTTSRQYVKGNYSLLGAIESCLEAWQGKLVKSLSLAQGSLDFLPSKMSCELQTHGVRR